MTFYNSIFILVNFLLPSKKNGKKNELLTKSNNIFMLCGEKLYGTNRKKLYFATILIQNFEINVRIDMRKMFRKK